MFYKKFVCSNKGVNCEQKWWKLPKLSNCKKDTVNSRSQSSSDDKDEALKSSPILSLCTLLDKSRTFASALVVEEICSLISEVQALHHMSGTRRASIQILRIFSNFRLVRDDRLSVFILPSVEKQCLEIAADTSSQNKALPRSRILQKLVFALSQSKAFHQIAL